MKCQKCGKYDATARITEVVGGIKNEIYLCHRCSLEYNQFHSIFKSNFDSLFDSIWKSPLSVDKSTLKACPNCKSTIAEIQSRGRLGCSRCYNIFSGILLPSLKNIHGSNIYKGKLPKRSRNISSIEALKQELAHAVDNQNFEKAAELRDKIRELEV